MSTTTKSPLLRLEGPILSDNSAGRLDGRLVERSRAGDADAFACLYDRYSERVFGYMYFQVQEEQVAEDLTARVFAKVWKNLGCYEPDKTPFGIWLYMIAREAAIEYRQSREGARAVTEIVSPADKGLEQYEPFKPCNSG